MDEETYQTLVWDIEKYHGKYKLKEGKLIKIKPNKELKVLKRNEIEPILSLAHEHPLSGHFGLEAILTKLKKRYYWPKMKSDVKVIFKLVINVKDVEKQQMKMNYTQLK